MEFEYFIFSAIIAFLYVLIKFKTRSQAVFFLPSTVFMLMWGLAITASIISQTTGLDKFGMGYSTTAPYIFWFIVTSFLGFFFSTNFEVVKKINYKFSPLYIDYLLSKLKFFIYLSFILGLFRIYIKASTFGWDTLYDYRQNAFLIGKLNSGIYEVVSQISSYVYILASFYIVLLAIKHACTTINFKNLLWYFILFAAQGLSIGGRMFVLDFISCYFFIFILIRSTNKTIFKKMEMLPFISSIAALLFIVMALGVIRNDSNNKSASEISNSDYYSKFLYLQDGIVYTSVFFNKERNMELNLDYGKNITGIDKEDSNYAKFRNRTDMETYLPFVTGVLVPLYFDFGFVGSLFVWFFVCFYFDILAKKMIKKGTIIGYLLIFVLMRYFYDTPMLVLGGRGFFRYLFVLLVLLLLSNRYFLNYDRWLSKYRKVT